MLAEPRKMLADLKPNKKENCNLGLKSDIDLEKS